MRKIDKFDEKYFLRLDRTNPCIQFLGKFGYRLAYFMRLIYYKSWLRLLMKYRAYGSLLDIGCGLGYFLRAVGKRYECVGVDISKVAIRETRRCGINVFRGSAKTPCFKDQSFDVITCFDLLEHLDEPSIAIYRLSSLLKTDGVFMMTMPNLDSVGRKIFKDFSGFWDNTHVSVLGRDVWIKLLEENGLTVRKLFSTSFYYIVVLVSRGIKIKAILRYLPYCMIGNVTRVLFALGFKSPPIGENLCILAQKTKTERE